MINTPHRAGSIGVTAFESESTVDDFVKFDLIMTCKRRLGIVRVTPAYPARVSLYVSLLSASISLIAK
jgi:hypothetical protein